MEHSKADALYIRSHILRLASCVRQETNYLSQNAPFDIRSTCVMNYTRTVKTYIKNQIAQGYDKDFPAEYKELQAAVDEWLELVHM